MIKSKEIILPALGKGFHLITDIIEQDLNDLPETGLLNIFIKHTSAAITINENADYSVRDDFETFFNDFVPENYKKFTHIFEGSDDMPAHLKSSIIGSSITVPVKNHKLNLGTWQGVYLCEFRNNGGRRKIVLSVYS